MDSLPNHSMNLWLQRLSVVAMVALAILLIAVGVVVYAPGGATNLVEGVANR